MSHSRTAPAARRIALVALLLASLVLVQALGLMHRIAHMPHAPGSAAAWSQLSAKVDPASAGWLQKLFAGHQHDGDCDVYDQLGHGDALASIAPALVPLEFVQAPVALHRGWHIATQSSGFLARGPPSLS
jgi:hypothetical protein